MTANQITGPNAGGPRQLAIQTPWAARVGQLGRSAAVCGLVYTNVVCCGV